MKKNPNLEGEDRLLDSIILLLKNFEYNCSYCKHLNKDEISCKAFPDVIPEPLFMTHVRHTKPMYGQKNNVVFEKAKV